jgi:hypothetical protein
MAARKAFLLRIDPELWGALEKWAADEFRSVNGQIEFLLARAVRAGGRGRTGRATRPTEPAGAAGMPNPPEPPAPESPTGS